MACGLLKHTDTVEVMLLLKPVRQICSARPSAYRDCLIVATIMALNDTYEPNVAFWNSVGNHSALTLQGNTKA